VTHQAALGPLVGDLRPLWRRFSDEGHRLYLVGGVVRDLLLGLPLGAADVDLTTDARPEVTRSIVAPLASALWVQGERFGTIGAHVGRWSVEITTHRSEHYAATSRKPEVVFGRDLQVDLSRRDFTINAMAFELPTGPLHDPFGGRDDLGARRLRTPLDPAISFDDDPLRMLRAARFVARFGLQPDPELVAVATAAAGRLRIVAAERIHDELERLLAAPDPAAGLRLLVTTGLLTQVLPDLGPVAGEADPRFRPGLRIDVVLQVLGSLGSPLARRVLLLWPLVEARGAEVVDRALVALRYPNAERVRTVALSSALRRVLQADEAAPALVRALTVELGPDGSELWALVAAMAPLALERGRLDEILSSRERLDAAGGSTSLAVPLDGRAVLARLGCDPGPVVGEALAMLRDRIVRDGPLDQQGAFDELDRWWSQRTP
jgi:poly(A) polymerase